VTHIISFKDYVHQTLFTVYLLERHNIDTSPLAHILGTDRATGINKMAKILAMPADVISLI
jgi:hypothetical protein